MKSEEITYKLVRYLTNGTDIVLPNYYYGSYEMDICRIMSSGFVVEYEIKISRGDFFADFNKREFYKEGELKHDNIKSGKRCNRFIFVTPKGLIKPEEIPDYCGLMEYEFGFTVIKNAPLLHRNKFDTSRYKSVALRCSQREHEAKSKYLLLRKELTIKS